MAKPHRYRNCKDCGKHRDECGGELSWIGLCIECATRRQREAATQISEHRGPAFHHWRKQMAASVGGVLLDDPRKSA